jgi:hypothetical protein
MNDKLLVSTRKGLFTASPKAGHWTITGVDFLGDNVTLSLTDRRDGRSYAALDHGHFGVKLHRSTPTGWEEIAAPVYPPKPDGYEEKDMWGRPLNWSTARIWALAAGNADEPGVIWCGTVPGGLFRSEDHGQNWQMVRSLWCRPECGWNFVARSPARKGILLLIGFKTHLWSTKRARRKLAGEFFASGRQAGTRPFR